MNRKLINLTFVLLMALFSSCAVEEVLEMPGLEKESMRVNFSLDMNMPSNTKAGSHTWGDNSNLNADDNYPESVGDTFENKIKTDHLLVFAYKPDGTFVGHLPILKAGVSEDGVVNFTCALKYSVHQQSGTDEYKFVVLANCIDKAYGFMYNEDGSPNIDAQMYSMPLENIPMWGVQSYEITYDGSVLRKKQDIGEISLLRATSKIGVRLSDELQAEGFRIKPGSVKLNYARPNGYSAPKNWNEVENTKALTHEDSFNPTSSSKVALSKDVEANAYGMTTNSYYLYVPETLNNDPNFQAGEDGVSELSMCIAVEKVENGEVVETYEFPYEKGIKFRTYVDGLPEGEAFNITRNHFYDYKITKINTTIKLELVEYSALPWVEKEVQIGDVTKYLVLNTDLVKMYSTNVDATTLKFISSSPIKRVDLKDVYGHNVNSEQIEKYQGEASKDGKFAYYITKFGQMVQLGDDPGFVIDATEGAHAALLARENVILDNIVAQPERNVLQGGIAITSPFMEDPSNENSALQESSHFDTVRYLEFEVENEQGLIETFRVMQYPPVMISNIQGYFSYRDDMRVDIEYYYDASQFTDPYALRKPVDNGEPIHYLNPIPPFFLIGGFFPYHVHEWDPKKEAFKHRAKGCGNYIGFDETPYGAYDRDHMRVDEYKGSPVSGVFHRKHYYWDDGSHFIGKDKNTPSTYYQNVGPVYSVVTTKEVQVEVTDDVTGETTLQTQTQNDTTYYRRHYTGNLFAFFYSKFVNKVYDKDSNNPNGAARLKGEADICSQFPVDEYNAWQIWGIQQHKNHRMYHIRINTTSPEYSLGRPTMVGRDGLPTSDPKFAYTSEGISNSRMVSPSFMVASQLGASTVPQNRDHYDVPKEEGMYLFAQRQCEQYAEAYYVDLDGDNEYDEGVEEVIHFNDWRLPTKAEVELLVKYQKNSRTLDNVLAGEKYFCASLVKGDYSSEANILVNNVNWDLKQTGYYVRCVRDVYDDKKIDENLKPLTLSPLLK